MFICFHRVPLFFTAFLNIYSCPVWPCCSQLLAIFLASAPTHNFFLSLGSGRSLFSSLCRLQVLLRSTPSVQDWLGHSSLCEIGKAKSVMFIIPVVNEVLLISKAWNMSRLLAPELLRLTWVAYFLAWLVFWARRDQDQKIDTMILQSLCLSEEFTSLR